MAIVLVLLGELRLRAQWVALSGLAVALLVAVLGFAMPVGMDGAWACWSCWPR